MTHRAPTLRVTALLAAVWVQFVLVGPGLHDPDCVHHRPGATGAVHIHSDGTAEEARAGDARTPGGQVARGDHGHAGHAGEGQVQRAPHDPGGHAGESAPSSTGDDCTCLGLCVPGAVVGLTLPQTWAPQAPAAPVVVSAPPQGPVAALLPSHPTHLPPSTGPPFGA